MILSNDYIVRCDNLAWRKYDDEVIIMSEDGSEIHSLNKVGSFIWELSDGNTKLDDIIANICNRFNVVEDLARIDTKDFIQQLIDKGLLQTCKHS